MEVTGECSAESSPHLGSPSLGTQCQPARTWRHRRFLAQDLHRPARLVEGNGGLRIWKTRCSDGYRERPLLEGITCGPPLGHPMEVIYIPAIAHYTLLYPLSTTADLPGLFSAGRGCSWWRGCLAPGPGVTPGMRGSARDSFLLWIIWNTGIFAAYGRDSRSVGSLHCCFVLFSVLLDADASDIRFLFIM